MKISTHFFVRIKTHNRIYMGRSSVRALRASVCKTHSNGCLKRQIGIARYSAFSKWAPDIVHSGNRHSQIVRTGPTHLFVLLHALCIEKYLNQRHLVTYPAYGRRDSQPRLKFSCGKWRMIGLQVVTKCRKGGARAMANAYGAVIMKTVTIFSLDVSWPISCGVR